MTNAAKQYYDKAKHEDDCGVEVVYFDIVAEIIELAQLEGYVQGLAAVKEMGKGKGFIGMWEELKEKELLAQKELQEKFNFVMKD